MNLPWMVEIVSGVDGDTTFATLCYHGKKKRIRLHYKYRTYLARGTELYAPPGLVSPISPKGAILYFCLGVQFTPRIRKGFESRTWTPIDNYKTMNHIIDVDLAFDSTCRLVMGMNWATAIKRKRLSLARMNNTITKIGNDALKRKKR
jgi:hypothetical protein